MDGRADGLHKLKRHYRYGVLRKRSSSSILGTSKPVGQCGLGGLGRVKTLSVWAVEEEERPSSAEEGRRRRRRALAPWTV